MLSLNQQVKVSVYWENRLFIQYYAMFCLNVGWIKIESTAYSQDIKLYF